MEKSSSLLSCEKCPSLTQTIFSNCKMSTLKIVSKSKVESYYKKGQTLFVQGSPSYGIYCIKKGALKISRLGLEGKDIIIELASAGDTLGAMSLFENSLHSTTATALNDVTVCFIDKKEALTYIKNHPELSLNFLKKMIHHKFEQQEKTYSSPHKTVRERIAELFIELKEKYSEKTKNGYKITIHLSREDIASIVGTATETVIRFISEFKNEGILTQEAKTLYIKDHQKLLKEANI